MTRTNTPLNGHVLAYLIWASALIVGAIAFAPGDPIVYRGFRWLAIAASAGLFFLGYAMHAQWRRRSATRWESTVWIGTFVLVAYILLRALTQHNL
jgi:hypothetical protein